MIPNPLTTATRRRRVAAAVLTAALLAVTGCSAGTGAGSATNTVSAPAATDGPVVIDFWHSSSGAAGKVVEDLVAKYNASNTDGVTVKAIYQGSYEDAISKFTNAVTSGGTPDLMQASDVNTSFMVDSGLVTPAEDAMAAYQVPYAAEKVSPAVKNYYTIDGKLWSVPFQVSQPLVYFNPDLIAKAGLDASKLPATTAELFNWARIIKEKTGVAGLTFHLNPWWNEEFASSAGIEYCTPGNGTTGAPVDAVRYTAASQVGVWNTIQELFTSKAIFNVGKDGSAAQNAFTGGSAAMLLSSSGSLGNVVKAKGTDFLTAPFPVDDAAKGGAVPGGNSVWIIGKDKSGATQRAAARFAAFLASPDSQVASFQGSGYLPASTDAQATAATSATPAQKVLLDQVAVTKSNVVTAGCHSGALNSIRLELQPVLEQIAAGTPVEAAFQQAEAKATSAIETYNARAGK
ncbi:extracellular solute-binding protein [Paenarthrobacter nicotinovorans]|uniref:Extracellular solute-binding protein n=1 Tax=Paenarthrobacter nicotinovorans TaxID=29320 RepID=A0ABV0GNJ4_PAENI|nr:extracellular solute-binding protein [Paenarthrobacter nicotinovorans]